MNRPEFDRYSGSYEELLKDPIRDRFTGGASNFFHERKRELVRGYFSAKRMNSHTLRYLDIGCGKGELLSLLRNDFGHVAGCDPSPGMLTFAQGVDVRVQDNPGRIPFNEEEFDVVSAVCVYHHVALSDRLALTREISRVLRPGGTFAIIEHNPYNPITKRIVSRTPVDEDAVLLKPSEARHWMEGAGFVVQRQMFFLYFPEPIYRIGGRFVEEALGWLPLGGQYAVFATRK